MTVCAVLFDDGIAAIEIDASVLKISPIGPIFGTGARIIRFTCTGLRSGVATPKYPVNPRYNKMRSI